MRSWARLGRLAGWIPLAAAIALGAAVAHTAQPSPPVAHLVIVVDGLRPDYVTPTVMPRLVRLGERGTVFREHHAVFPTVTRVNAPSFVTGAYPETHGLMGNTIYIPSVSATKSLGTGDRENLEAVERADGKLLTAPALGEILERAGKKLLVVSSGSSGSALLLNHLAPRTGGAIVHTEFARPPELSARVAGKLGPPPPAGLPNAARNRHAVDAYLMFGLDDPRPDVTFMWLSDPDTTAHARGMEAAVTRESLALVDAEIGRVEDAIQAKGLSARTNVIVTSDHGFSTHQGGFNLATVLEPFVRKLPDGSPDIVTAEGAIYLRGSRDAARVGAIVDALQRTPAIGAIFTRPRATGEAEGVVPGTLSFDVARWNHARAGDILVSANWSRGKSEDAHYEGRTTQGGVAGHGTSSPFDIHNTLMAAGPDFRAATVSDIPTGNVDVAPTLLHLLGLKPAPTMSGRVISEALRTGPPLASVRVERVQETVKTADGSYELTAHISVAAGHRYLDFTEVKRR